MYHNIIIIHLARLSLYVVMLESGSYCEISLS